MESTIEVILSNGDRAEAESPEAAIERRYEAAAGGRGGGGMTASLTALYDESATEEEVIACYQYLVDSGTAWLLEGHVGRTADALLEAGEIALGPEGHRDFYGGYVPSRFEVEPGTKGSPEYVLERSGREVSGDPEARDRAVEGIAKTVEQFDRASDDSRSKETH